MKRKSLLLIPAISLLLTFSLQAVHAQYGLKETADAAGLETTSTLPDKVGQAINIILSVVGLIFLILAVYGGIKILTSRGDSAKIKTGQDTLLYAVIGLIVITASYALSTYVIGAVTGR